MVLSVCRRISTSSRRSASSSARVPQATVPSGSSRFMHRRRDVRVGQAELAPGRERLQRRSTASWPRRSRFGRAVAGAEEHAGEAAQPVALAQPVAERPMALAAPPASPRSPRRSRRRGRRRGSGPRAARRARAAADPPRSAGRARTAPPPRDGRRPTSARAAAAGANRSTASASPAASAWCASRAGSGAPAGGAASAASAARCSAARRCGAQRLLDRHPRQLVAEGDAVGRRRSACPSRGTRRGRRARPRRPAPRAARARRAAGTRRPRPAAPRAVALRRAARARTASRTVGGISPIAAGQHLGEEERVARRAAVELVGVDAVRLGELRDGVAARAAAARSARSPAPWPARRARPAAGGAASSSSSR